MKVKVLFVDLGGVVVVNKVKEIGEKFEKSDGLSREMTSKVFRYIQTAERKMDEVDEYLESEGMDPEVWDRFTKELYSSEMINDMLIELLYQCKSRGISIVFTTNNSSAASKIIQKYNIENLVDLVINSSELQVAKPDKLFWEVAFAETEKLIPELRREDILVIDDSKTNCQSADEFGFQSYKYTYDPVSQVEIYNLIN